MKRKFLWFGGLVLAAAVMLSGCMLPKPSVQLSDDLSDFQAVATRVEYPTVPVTTDEGIMGVRPPRSLVDQQVEYWDVTLQQVVHMALTRSKVLRDLGGTVLRSPENLRTTFEPAIRESDPRFGVEAALSAFDADFATSFFAERNDRRYNNRFLGDLGFYDQDLNVFETQISKRAATGSQFALRQNVDFDRDSALGNEFPEGAWNVNFEGEFRHPLLQGGGLRFNRIAGPDGIPGVFTGVVVARIGTDISLADFQLGLRDFLSNVENAYWDLYYAYRNLDAKIRARDAALETWRKVNALFQAGRRGGEAEKEAQAREQFYRFEEEVQNALAGRQVEGTRTNNGSSPGTFRPTSGVQVAERRLRLLIGLPANDQRLLRPADEPAVAPVAFDWWEIAPESLARRAELRRQRWQVKRREMELIAARNYLLPNLDLVGLYRWRGFGEKLIDSDRSGKDRFDNAYMDLTSGDFQEWHFGFEFSVPIGFRQGHSAVRNAELNLARSRTVLREQERQIVHNVSNAVAEFDRAYAVLKTSYNRTVAARQQLAAVEAAYEDNKVEFFVVLDAQRRYADAESRYFQARVELALALRSVHFEKGSLLEYCGVTMAEGAWPEKAYLDAARRECLRGRPMSTSYIFKKPPIVSYGPLPPPAQSVRLPTPEDSTGPKTADH